MAIKRITTNLIEDGSIGTIDIANNAITAAKITDGNITTAKLADLNVTAGKLAGTLDLTGKTVTVATATTGDSDTSPASTAFVQQEIAALVDSSPSALNTLNELANALGDNENFATDVTASIATKAPLDSPVFSSTYTSGQDETLAEFRRDGGAVAAKIIYADATTDMEFGTTTSHALSLTTADTRRLTIDSSGRVGIGTDSPSSTLHLKDNFSSGVAVVYDRTENAAVSNLFYTGVSSTFNSSFMWMGTAVTSFVINNSGNVGIGTNSPVAKLDVRMSDSNGAYGRGRDGNLNLENTNTSVTEGGWLSISGYMGNSAASGQYQMGYISGGKQTTAADGDYGGYLTFWTTSGGANGEANSGGYERMRIDSSGNVGIGTTAPAYKLDISGTSNDLTPLIRGTASNTPSGNFNWATEFIAANLANDKRLTHIWGKARTTYGMAHVSYLPKSTASESYLALGLWGANDILNVLGNGNVGIGTSAPAHPLSVQAANAKITACSTGDSQVIGFQARYLLDHATLYGSFEYHTGDAQLYIDNHFAGNNGVYGDINFRNKDNGGGSLVNRMKIKGSTGNVGIGNTEASHKLHVEANGSGAISALRLANENTSVGDGAKLLFTSGTSTTGAGIAGYGTALNTADLVFYAGGDNERMRIHDNGRDYDFYSDTANAYAPTINLYSKSSGAYSGQINFYSKHNSNEWVAASIFATGGSGYGTGNPPSGGMRLYVRGAYGSTHGINAVSIAGNGVVSGDFNDTSDVALKKDIVSLNASDSLTAIKALNPVSFKWKLDNETRSGFIAQEVETHLPNDVVGENWRAEVGGTEGDPSSRDEGSKGKAVNSTGILAHAVKVIQEQQTAIEDLQSRIATLEE